MIREMIILAGGLGTRLRDTVPDLPKCMAPVAGKPFLHYLIKHFTAQGVNRFVFSLGYRHEAVEDFLKQEFLHYPQAGCAWCVEDSPLGTGGAVRKAASMVGGQHVWVANGDTFFDINLAEVAALHASSEADCTLSLKQLRETDRYGVVDLDPAQRIVLFREKQYYPQGLINGGVYALNLPAFTGEPLPEVFSFEKDYLEANCPRGRFFGSVQEGYFIDIGVPADFHRANTDFTKLFP